MQTVELRVICVAMTLVWRDYIGAWICVRFWWKVNFFSPCLIFCERDPNIYAAESLFFIDSVNQVENDYVPRIYLTIYGGFQSKNISYRCTQQNSPKSREATLKNMGKYDSTRN